MKHAQLRYDHLHSQFKAALEEAESELKSAEEARSLAETRRNRARMVLQDFNDFVEEAKLDVCIHTDKIS